MIDRCRCAWMLALVGGCYHPSYDRLLCGKNNTCPSGLHCSDVGVCERGPEDAGSSPDVLDAPDARDIDASVSLRFLSCVGLPLRCGPQANGSCCESLDVPGGFYYRSYDGAGDLISGMQDYPATISRFHLDKYEVTVARFRSFVLAGKGTRQNPPEPGSGAHPNLPDSGWNPSWNALLVADTTALLAALKCESTFPIWTDAEAGNEQRPLNCMTWYEAMAFCIWDGGYLPTEAEWNYAAAGGDKQRAYPWSDPAESLTISDTFASYFDGTNCVGDGIAGCAITDFIPVGSKPAGNGLWGHSDLGGNVWEWTLDWSASYVVDCMDCANLSIGSNRVIRGGSFFLDQTNLRTASRTGIIPTGRASVGVRCARPPLN
jgi:formylglycine-generating enzyme